jgi:hypothetical protein
VPVFQNPKKNFLHEILGHGPLRGEVEEKLEQRAVIPFEERLQFRDVPGPHFQHDLFVFHLNPLIDLTYEDTGETAKGYESRRQTDPDVGRFGN